MYTPKAMLVTGGAGFIGSHLVRNLLERFPETGKLLVVDAGYVGSDRSRLKSVETSIEYIPEDVRDTGRMRQLIGDHAVDTVIHTAAQTHVDRSITEPLSFVSHNVDGTASMLEAARVNWQGRQDVRFYQMSTDEVFGELPEDGKLFDENSPYAPRNPYSASKAAADHLVLSYHATYGLPVLIGCCSNNYGPGQHQEKFIPKALASMVERTAIPLYGDGLQQRDWLYVTDHTDAVCRIITRGTPGSRYVIGTGNMTSNRELLRVLAAEAAARLGTDRGSLLELVTSVNDRPGHDRAYGIDAGLLRSELGWVVRTQLQEGLRSVVSSYIADNDE